MWGIAVQNQADKTKEQEIEAGSIWMLSCVKRFLEALFLVLVRLLTSSGYAACHGLAL